MGDLAVSHPYMFNPGQIVEFIVIAGFVSKRPAWRLQSQKISASINSCNSSKSTYSYFFMPSESQLANKLWGYLTKLDDRSIMCIQTASSAPTTNFSKNQRPQGWALLRPNLKATVPRCSHRIPPDKQIQLLSFASPHVKEESDNVQSIQFNPKPHRIFSRRQPPHRARNVGQARIISLRKSTSAGR